MVQGLGSTRLKVGNEGIAKSMQTTERFRVYSYGSG